MKRIDIRDSEKKKKLSFQLLWLTEMVSKVRRVYSPEEFSNAQLKDLLMEK